MGPTAKARHDVADVLGQALPDVDVVSDDRSPQQLPRRRVVVVSKGGRPADVACPAPTVELDVIAVTHLTTPGPADDDVDDHVDDVLAALDAAGVEWSTYERGTFADVYPCYRITTEVRT